MKLHIDDFMLPHLLNLFPVARGTDIQTKEVRNVPCVDVDAIDSDHGCENANPYTPLAAVGEASPTKEGKSGLETVPHSNSTSHEQHLHIQTDNHETGSFFPELEMRASSPGDSQSNCALVESPSSVLSLL